MLNESLLIKIKVVKNQIKIIYFINHGKIIPSTQSPFLELLISWWMHLLLVHALSLLKWKRTGYKKSMIWHTFSVSGGDSGVYSYFRYRGPISRRFTTYLIEAQVPLHLMTTRSNKARDKGWNCSHPILPLNGLIPLSTRICNPKDTKVLPI